MLCPSGMITDNSSKVTNTSAVKRNLSRELMDAAGFHPVYGSRQCRPKEEGKGPGLLDSLPLRVLTLGNLYNIPSKQRTYYITEIIEGSDCPTAHHHLNGKVK